MEKSKEEVQILSELIEDAGIFESRGYSIVKVTKNGVENSRKIPIKSTGVAEYQEQLADLAPRPPVTKELIKKDSPEGRSLGLPHDKICLVYDNTDEKYIDKLNEHNQDFLWRVVVFALDMDLKVKGGAIAETYEDKKRILQSNGITGHQVDKIFKDVQDLTKFAEDREDFLPGS